MSHSDLVHRRLSPRTAAKTRHLCKRPIRWRTWSTTSRQILPEMIVQGLMLNLQLLWMNSSGNILATRDLYLTNSQMQAACNWSWARAMRPYPKAPSAAAGTKHLTLQGSWTSTAPLDPPHTCLQHPPRTCPLPIISVECPSLRDRTRSQTPVSLPAWPHLRDSQTFPWNNATLRITTTYVVTTWNQLTPLYWQNYSRPSNSCPDKSNQRGESATLWRRMTSWILR